MTDELEQARQIVARDRCRRLRPCSLWITPCTCREVAREILAINEARALWAETERDVLEQNLTALGKSLRAQGEARLHAEAQVKRLVRLLEWLHALVRGECPSLLNEDSGGDPRLDLEIAAVLADIAKESQAPDGGLLCSDCPPAGYPTERTRCEDCPRRATNIAKEVTPSPTRREIPAREMTDEAIAAEMAGLDERWKKVHEGDGHCGSPGEWIVERGDELLAEQKRRAADIAKENNDG